MFNSKIYAHAETTRMKVLKLTMLGGLFTVCMFGVPVFAYLRGLFMSSLLRPERSSLQEHPTIRCLSFHPNAPLFQLKTFGNGIAKGSLWYSNVIQHIRRDLWGVATSPRIPQVITKKWRYWTYKAILGVGFPLHKPYPYSLYRWVPPF